MRDQIVEYAKTFIGTPYKTLDCNEFVRKVYRKFGVELGDPSAGNAKDLYNKGCMISKAELQLGDLIFWKNPRYVTRWKTIHHVAIYLGDGKIIESAGEGVRLNDVWETSKWKIIFYANPLKLIQEDEEVVTAKSSTLLIGQVQQALIDAGYPGGMDVTKLGSWGPKTDAAIKAFKSAHGLPADNIVNSITLCALMSALGNRVDSLRAEAQKDKATFENIEALAGGRL